MINMRHTVLQFFIIISFLTFGFVLNAQEIKMIENGKVEIIIVLPEQPSQIESHSGELLSKYLSRMANQSEMVKPIIESNFEIKGKKSIILIGKSETNKKIRELVQKGLVVLSKNNPGGDGIVIKTVRDKDINYLVLGGSSDRGVLYAVVHFLEHFGKIGIFWDGEYVPERRNWIIENIDVSERPYFSVRQYMQGCAFTYSYMDWWDLNQLKRHLDWAVWKKQSRLMWPGGLIGKKENPDNFEKFMYDNFQESKKYAREVLGMELMCAEDHIYNYDPFPEQRVSEDPEEENRIIVKFVEDTYKRIQSNDPEGIWYASGWALLNPGWRIETAKAFFDAIGDRKFYIADVWGEASPIYKKYDYFYGHDWLFGVLHSFGGNTTLHGDCAGLVRNTQAVSHDPKANRCIGYYINPEVIIYNDFYFDLATRLSWRPNDVNLDAFVKDYTERRYGEKSSVVMAKAYQELLDSVYGINDTTDPFWQGRMGNVFPSILTTRIGFIPHLEKALEIALSQKNLQSGNTLYGKDLVDITKQLVADVGNGYALQLYNAFLWNDKIAFERSVKALKICLDAVDTLLASRKEYYIGPVLYHIYDYPGMTEQRKRDAEYYFKDNVLTFALRDNLRDYNSRDIKEVFDMYYRPRVEAYLGYLTEKFNKGDHNFNFKEIEPLYKQVEEKWMKTPIAPVNTISPKISDIKAVEQALREMKLLSASLVVKPEFTIKNGGFEEGNGKPIGWNLTMQNVEVTIPRDVKPYIGFYALHFSAPEELNQYKTFSAKQTVKWQDKSRILFGYCLEKYSQYANAYLKVEGFDSTGKKRTQVLYFWGGDSWDLKNASPEQTGGFYSVAQKLEIRQKGVKGKSEGSHIIYSIEWQELNQDPAEDLNTIHGAGTWEKLGIDTVSLTIGTWVYEYNNNFIDGWFDELRIIAPPKKN